MVLASLFIHHRTITRLTQNPALLRNGPFLPFCQ
jgi:hypothetical protein